MTCPSCGGGLLVDNFEWRTTVRLRSTGMFRVAPATVVIRPNDGWLGCVDCQSLLPRQGKGR